jgi:hypothetical protein
LPGEQIEIANGPTGRKVSEILTEFAEPWLDQAQNDHQRKVAIGLAVLAWNIANMPERERCDGMNAKSANQLNEPAKAILEEMIARKVALYPEDTRAILDYEFTGAGDNLRVDVACSLLRKKVEEPEKGVR